MEKEKTKKLVAGKIYKTGFKYCVLKCEKDGVLLTFFKDRPEKVDSENTEFCYKLNMKGGFVLPKRILRDYGRPETGNQVFDCLEFKNNVLKLLMKRTGTEVQPIKGCRMKAEVSISSKVLLKEAETFEIPSKYLSRLNTESVIQNLLPGRLAKVTFVNGNHRLCMVTPATNSTVKRKELKQLPYYDELKEEFGANFKALPYEELSYICDGSEISIPYNDFDRVIKSGSNVHPIYYIIPRKVKDDITGEDIEPAKALPKKIHTNKKIVCNPEVMQLLRKVRKLQIACDSLQAMVNAM